MKPTMSFKLKSLFALSVLLSFFTGCAGNDLKPVTETGYYLGTLVKISVYEKAPEGYSAGFSA